MKEIKLIIFDVDGLMIDSESVWREAYRQSGQMMGLKDYGAEIFLEFVGKNGAEVVETIEGILGKEKGLELRSKAREIGIKKLKEEVPVKKGLYEILEFLEKYNLSKAVATSTERYLTEERLEKINILEKFDYTICGDEVKKRKPNPELYLNILRHFQVKPEEAIVLEDSYFGVEAAYNAKIPCIMVPDLLPVTEKQKKETIFIAENLLEAKEFLKSIL